MIEQKRAGADARMKYVVGIDLGSTTTKAVVLGEEGDDPRPRHHQQPEQLRRRLPDRARRGAHQHALLSGRRRSSSSAGSGRGRAARVASAELERLFRLQQFRSQLRVLADELHRVAVAAATGLRRSTRTSSSESSRAWKTRRRSSSPPEPAQERLLPRPRRQLATWRSPRSEARRTGSASTGSSVSSTRRSSTSRTPPPPRAASRTTRSSALGADWRLPRASCPRGRARRARRARAGRRASAPATGGRRLPFPEGQIRSEILCHGLGAHAMFPDDAHRSRHRRPGHQGDPGGRAAASSRRFQMNDRCAAGCGRYLGYIADEMNLGLHELGPARGESPSASCGSTRPARCSPAPSCASGSRSARSARTSSPGSTGPSSCGRCRCSPARAG